MMIPHPSLRKEVAHWVEDSSPPNPWLHDRVFAGLRRQAGRRNGRPASGAATLLAWTFVVGLATALIATHVLAAEVQSARESAQAKTTAVLQYRALVQQQYAALYGAVHRSDNPCYTGVKLLLLCRSMKSVARDDVTAFRKTLQEATLPPGFRGINESLVSELQSLASVLDVQLQALSSPDPSSASVGFDLIDLGGVSGAIAEVDCWPQSGAAATQANDFASRRPPPATCAR